MPAPLPTAMPMTPTDRSDRPNPDARPTEKVLHSAADDALSLPANEAASLLDISPATLRAWEQAFGFPASVSSEQPASNYLITELVALHDALPEALSITSAIHTARRSVDHPI